MIERMGESQQARHTFVYRLLILGILASQLLLLRVGILTVGDLLLITAAVVGLISMALNRGERIQVSSILLGILILVAVGIASVNAIAPVESLTVGARLVLLAVVVPGLATLTLRTPARITAALTALGVGGAISGAAGIAQALVPSAIIPGSMVTNAGRYGGLTGHVSDQGGVTSIAMIALVAVLIVGTKRQRLLAGLSTPFALGGLVLSGSVSGMLALAVGGAVMLFTGVMRFRYVLLSLAVGVPSLWIALDIQARSSSVALDPIERILLTLGETESATGVSSTASRFDTYGIAIERWIDAGFAGNGLDPASSIVVGLYPAHNILIGAAFQGGTLLLIALTWAIIRPFTGRWIRPRVDRASGALLAVGLAAVVFSMTAPSLFNRYFWIPLAVMWGARALHRRGGAVTERIEAPASRLVRR